MIDSCRDLRPYAIAIGLLLLAWLAYSAVIGRPVFPLDDAYITLHNAQVLRSGRDSAYAGTPALVGATSVVHTLLVAGLMSITPGIQSLVVSEWLALIAFVCGLIYLAQSCGLSKGKTWAIVATGVLVGRVPHQFMNGLETGLGLAVVTWAIALACAPRPSFWLAGLCGLMPFVRPELGLLSLFLMLYQVVRRWEEGSHRMIAADILVAFAAALPFALVMHANTGSVIPETIAAKRYFFAEGDFPTPTKTKWVRRCLIEFFASMGLVSLGALMLWKTRVGQVGLVFFACFVALFYVQFPGALGHNEERYLHIFVPFLLYGLVLLIRTPGSSARILAFAACAQAVIFSPYWWRQHLELLAFTRNELQPLAAWCNRNLPPQSKVLVHDAGYLSTTTDLRLFDLVGLKSPQFVKIHRELTFPNRGNNRGDAIREIALQSQADYLIVLDGWERPYHIAEALSVGCWRVHSLRVEGQYRVYRILRV